MTTTQKEMKFWEEVRYIVTTIEQTFLRERKLPWETTREFAELYNKYYPLAYRLLRAAADFWNQNLSKDYKVMYDCDYHGFRWRFHKDAQELKDLCWIAAIRTEGHNKRSLGNFDKAIEINSLVKKEIKLGKTEIVIPSSVKNYEDNNTEN